MMGMKIESKKLEQYSYTAGGYDVVVEYVTGDRRPDHMVVTIHKRESSGVVVLKSRPELDTLITLLQHTAALDDEKKEESRNGWK